MAEQAKAAAADFLKQDGQRNTTIHEKVAPAVVHENLTGTRHEVVTTAINREIHQEHYHTTVLPVIEKQTLPEQHTYNVTDVEHRTFHHGDSDEIKDRIARDAAQFKDERTVAEASHAQSTAPTVVAEHVHHHIHEEVRPVLQRETIQPIVIHTTIPVHEVYHYGTQHHHASTALPAMSMADFKRQGAGRDTTTEGSFSEPKTIGDTLRTDPGYSTGT